MDGLLDQYPDLSGGPAQDVEMMDLPSDQAPDRNQPLNASPVKFRPEIGDPLGIQLQPGRSGEWNVYDSGLPGYGGRR